MFSFMRIMIMTLLTISVNIGKHPAPEGAGIFFTD